MTKVTANITGTSQFTDPLSPLISPTYEKQSIYGFLNISIQGNGWSATIVLQRSFDDGSSWHDVDSFASPIEICLNDPEKGVLYRLGIPSDGSYSSGIIPVRLSK